MLSLVSLSILPLAQWTRLVSWSRLFPALLSASLHWPPPRLASQVYRHTVLTVVPGITLQVKVTKPRGAVELRADSCCGEERESKGPTGKGKAKAKDGSQRTAAQAERALSGNKWFAPDALPLVALAAASSGCSSHTTDRLAGRWSA